MFARNKVTKGHQPCLSSEKSYVWFLTKNKPYFHMQCKVIKKFWVFWRSWLPDVNSAVSVLANKVIYH